MSKVQYSPIRADELFPVGNSSSLNLLISKADVWSHEHEWRLICETDEEYLPFDCISNIYVGANYDTPAAEYKELIKAVDTYEQLSIWKFEVNLKRYQIDSTEIHNSFYHTLSKKTKKCQSFNLDSLMIVEESLSRQQYNESTAAGGEFPPAAVGFVMLLSFDEKDAT